MRHPTQILLLLPLLGAFARGQDASAPGETVPLDRFEVRGVPVEDSVNPLARPLEGVFGAPRSVLETPRSVTSITQALLRERGINGVAEFTPFAPGSQAPASYGKTSIPSIRGDLAETFINGQRVSYNNFGYAPSFNHVEAVEVVRGPGPAPYGSGFFTGGYVNYVTKQPKYSPETTVTARVGTWAPGGGSWLNGSWQVDATGPLADGRSAWRVSYEGKEDDTFFRRGGGRDDRQDLFAAWIRRGDGVTLEANVQVFWQSAPQLLGVNRPNQDLIDQGWYYTGDLPNLGYSDTTGALAGVIGGVDRVQVPRDATLLSVGDFSNAAVARGQFTATVDSGPDRRWVHRTLAESVDRRRYHAFEYAEWVEQLTFEHRSEWHAALDGPGGPHALVAGAAVRWEDRRGFTNYFNEYFFQYDITRPRRVFSHAEDYPSSYWPGYEGPGGRLFFRAEDGSPETTDSTLWNPAVFVQDEVRLGPRTSLLAGLRADGFLAEARDPLGDGASPRWNDRHEEAALSWNGSLLHRITPAVSAYVTLQHAYAVHGNVTGGGIMLKGEELPDGSVRGVVDPSDFTNLSRLAEAGLKASLLDNTLYAGLAVFDQRREEVELGGDVKNLRMRGLELELVYQPNLRLNGTFNVAFTDGRLDQSTASQAGGTSLYNLYALGKGPGGKGNGLGFSWGKLPPGDYRIPGLSRWIVNSSASYRFESGLGGGFGASWQGEQPGNLLNEYHVPAQVFLNAFVFYRQPRWEVNLDLLNVLDRRNWIHNGDNWSNNVLIFQDLPLRFEGYVKVRF